MGVCDSSGKAKKREKINPQIVVFNILVSVLRGVRDDVVFVMRGVSLGKSAASCPKKPFDASLWDNFFFISCPV
jgi:hypothetical protein